MSGFANMPAAPLGRTEIQINCVVLGKSGSGKSTFMETLLDPQHSPAKMSPLAVTRSPTRLTSKTFDLDAQRFVKLTCFDMPGLFERAPTIDGTSTTRVNETICEEIGEALRKKMPEINAFIICHSADARLDEYVVTSITEFLGYIGPRNYANTFLLLTHCDQMKVADCDATYNLLKQHFRAIGNVTNFDAAFGVDRTDADGNFVERKRVLYASAHDEYLYTSLMENGMREARDHLALDVYDKRMANIVKLMGHEAIPYENTVLSQILENKEFKKKLVDELNKMPFWLRLWPG